MRIQPLYDPRHPALRSLGALPLLRSIRRNLLEVTLRRPVEISWNGCSDPTYRIENTLLAHCSHNCPDRASLSLSQPNPQVCPRGPGNALPLDRGVRKSAGNEGSQVKPATRPCTAHQTPYRNLIASLRATQAFMQTSCRKSEV